MYMRRGRQRLSEINYYIVSTRPVTNSNYRFPISIPFDDVEATQPAFEVRERAQGWNLDLNENSIHYRMREMNLKFKCILNIESEDIGSDSKRGFTARPCAFAINKLWFTRREKMNNEIQMR